MKFWSEDIIKGFKYLRKEWRGGRWVYYYDDPIGIERKGKFGEIWTNFKNNPYGAFKKLLKERRGQVTDVFTIKLPVIIRNRETGKWEVVPDRNTKGALLADTNVDLVFGDDRRNVGLDHIIRKHFIRQNDYMNIKVLEDSIVNTFDTLDVEDKSSNLRVSLGDKIQISATDKKGNHVVIAVQIQKDDKGVDLIRHFILSSYDMNREWHEKRNSSEEASKRKKWFENR